jgi:hypothetical protein
MLKRIIVPLTATVLLVSCTAGAQIAPAAANQTAQLSPAMKTSAVLQGKTITVDYSAPSMRGRAILGDLIKPNKVWRMGDNSTATLTTPINLRIGDINVPAGTYSLYSLITEKGNWLIINKQTVQSGDSYNQSQDIGRTLLNTNDTDGPIEKLLIDFEYTHGQKTELHVKWGYSESWVHIKVF